MISNITIKSTQEMTDIDLEPVNIFIGPNNSGKSTILNEIKTFLETASTEKMNLLKNISFQGTNKKNVEGVINSVTIERNEGQLIIGNLKGSHSFNSEQENVLKEVIENPNQSIPAFCSWYLKYAYLLLDGKSRIQTVKKQSAGNMQKSESNILQRLFRNDQNRKIVRSILYDAFSLYFTIDPTDTGNLQIRFSKKPPENDFLERGLHNEAIQFHKNAKLIDEFSDGVKAYTGIISELYAGDPKIILIDEPEAFLHPALSFKLGKELSKAASDKNKIIFASTHSASFVMGCIQSGIPVNIIRLTFSNEISTCRLLSSSEVLELMRHPLLRSSGTINSLFYENVVITESDSDRAFYQEINDRLLAYKNDWGIPNCLFINAQNKQTIHYILKPLRDMGISSVAIVDIDVLKEGGKVWTNLLSSANIPKLNHQPYGASRQAVLKALKTTGKDMKRDGGISLLKGGELQAAIDLLDNIKKYGIFVVPNGELESWLTYLNVGGHGSNWLIKIFESMGSNPNEINYVKPNKYDVWKFINDIKSWLLIN